MTLQRSFTISLCAFTHQTTTTTTTKSSTITSTAEDNRKKQNEHGTSRQKESNFQQKTHSWFDGCFALCLFSFEPTNLLCLFLVRVCISYIVFRWCIHMSIGISRLLLLWLARTHTNTYAGCEGLRANKTILFFFLHWWIRVSIEWYIYIHINLLFGSLCFAFVYFFFLFLLSSLEQGFMFGAMAAANRNGIMRIESECIGRQRKNTKKTKTKKKKEKIIAPLKCSVLAGWQWITELFKIRNKCMQCK